MPTYAYACTACSHAFDAVQSFSDDALTQCPECTGPLRKQYGSIGVTFNGSGFYRTDSRSGGTDVKKENTGAASLAPKGSETSSSTGAPAPAPAAS